MLKIVRNMGQLPFSDLMRVYAEENLALGRRRWPREPQPRQLALAEELGLPVIVHDREAHGDSLAIVLEYPEVRGVFHCFSGSPEMAAELLIDLIVNGENAQRQKIMIEPELVEGTSCKRR